MPFPAKVKRCTESLQACPLRHCFAMPLPGLRLPASASLPLASCWPRPQQLLPVSATGGGRRRCSQRERLWQAGRRKKAFRRLRLREGQVIWQSGKIATYHRAKTHFAKVAICQSAGILTPLCQKGQNAKLANWQNIT